MYDKRYFYLYFIVFYFVLIDGDINIIHTQTIDLAFELLIIDK